MRGLFKNVLRATLLLAVMAVAAPSQQTPPSEPEPTPVATQHDEGSHQDPVVPLLLGISVILLAAKLGGDLAVRLRQPAVLGELLVGVLLGNLVLTGWNGLEFLRPGPEGEASQHLVATTLDMLARIGVILLLFEVGLESNLSDMRRVGVSALLVATVGVVLPLVLGYFVGRWLLPDRTWHVHLFIGATLTATSVGITARVLKDLGQMQRPEAQIILGAAVIDDVLGLIVLAVVQAIIVQGSASLGQVAWIVGKAVIFLIGAVVLGEWLSPRLFWLASRLRVHGMLVVTGLVFCFALSWLAGIIGLAPIVGAFAAGLILDERHYALLRDQEERSLEDLVLPVAALFVPIFFVMMGFQVQLAYFADTHVLGLALGITLVAIIGKQACSLAIVERGLDRLSVGIGMIPRGEVGLIFAALGHRLLVEGAPVVDPALYTAIIVMVMVTTLVTPPLLGWSLTRGQRTRASVA